MSEETKRTVEFIKTFNDILKIVANSNLSKEDGEKLTEFVNLLVKCLIANEKITTVEENGLRIVSIREGKLSYSAKADPELIRIVMYGNYQVKGE